MKKKAQRFRFWALFGRLSPKNAFFTRVSLSKLILIGAKGAFRKTSGSVGQKLVLLNSTTGVPGRNITEKRKKHIPPAHTYTHTLQIAHFFHNFLFKYSAFYLGATINYSLNNLKSKLWLDLHSLLGNVYPRYHCFLIKVGSKRKIIVFDHVQREIFFQFT